MGNKPNFNAEVSGDSLKELKEVGLKLWEIKNKKSELKKQEKDLNEAKDDLEAKASAFLEEYNLPNFDFGPAKITVAHMASFKATDKEEMKKGLRDMKIKLSPLEEKDPIATISNIYTYVRNALSVTTDDPEKVIDTISDIIKEHKDEISVYDTLSTVDSKTLNKWANEQKASKEELGDYNFELRGVEFKEYTQLRLLKNKEDKTKK